MEQVLVTLLGVFGTIIVGLTVALTRRNNKNHRQLHSNPSDPDKVFLGDVTVGWWEKKMEAWNREIVDAINNLKLPKDEE